MFHMQIASVEISRVIADGSDTGYDVIQAHTPCTQIRLTSSNVSTAHECRVFKQAVQWLKTGGMEGLLGVFAWCSKITMRWAMMRRHSHADISTTV